MQITEQLAWRAIREIQQFCQFEQKKLSEYASKSDSSQDYINRRNEQLVTIFRANNYMSSYIDASSFLLNQSVELKKMIEKDRELQMVIVSVQIREGNEKIGYIYTNSYGVYTNSKRDTKSFSYPAIF